MQNNFFKFADWPFSFKNLQIGPFVQILSRSSFHNTCQLITGSQAQVSAYKRPQSLQNQTLHANSSKKSPQTHFSFSHFTKTDQTQIVQEQLEDSTNLQTLTDSVTLPNNKFITKSFSFFAKFNITKPLHSSKSLQFHKEISKITRKP